MYVTSSVYYAKVKVNNQPFLGGILIYCYITLLCRREEHKRALENQLHVVKEREEESAELKREELEKK